MNPKRDLERDLEEWLDWSAESMSPALRGAIEDVPARHSQVNGRRWFDRSRAQLVAVAVVASAALVVAAVIGADTLDQLRRAIGNPPLTGEDVASIDNVANPQVADTFPFVWAGNLDEASTEAGEAFGCANGDTADRSVWLAWTAPAAGTMRVTIAAGGLTEPVSSTNAAIFGPFQERVDRLPARDELRWCVNGVGEEYTLTEVVAAGRYLIQLSAVSTSETRASIRLEFDPASP
jgi:hypothetical protein